MDLQKIVKILNLTMSENDHEALLAIRMANKILKSENKTWENFVQKAKSTEYDKSWQRPAGEPKQEPSYKHASYSYDIHEEVDVDEIRPALFKVVKVEPYTVPFEVVVDEILIPLPEEEITPVLEFSSIWNEPPFIETPLIVPRLLTCPNWPLDVKIAAFEGAEKGAYIVPFKLLVSVDTPGKRDVFEPEP